MEARVDVRKLQILNDRINQTIDALNQVRFSVHGLGQMGNFQQGFGGGLGHTGGFPQGIGGGFGQMGGLPQGIGGGFGQMGNFQQGLGGGLGYPSIPGFPTGLQHSPFTNPYVGNPYTNVNQGLYPQWNVGQNPFGHSPFGTVGQGNIGTGGQTPWGVGGNVGGFGGGLFHSTPDFLEQRLIEVRAADPYRLTQTFPFIVT